MPSTPSCWVKSQRKTSTPRDPAKPRHCAHCQGQAADNARDASSSKGNKPCAGGQREVGSLCPGCPPAPCLRSWVPEVPTPRIAHLLFYLEPLSTCSPCMPLLYLHLKYKRQSEGFPGDSVVKNLSANADVGSIPGPGRSHMPRSHKACAPQLLNLCSRARAPQQRKPPR